VLVVDLDLDPEVVLRHVCLTLPAPKARNPGCQGPEGVRYAVTPAP
jgi:hypothetical protein